jgi:hypothetical protein
MQQHRNRRHALPWVLTAMATMTAIMATPVGTSTFSPDMNLGHRNGISARQSSGLLLGQLA